MKVRLWGVRGTTPTPERGDGRYGGNTSCVEVRLDNDTLIILDCGSGLRGLGKSLMREFADRTVQAHIFLTHFHWDHIQGIPFFLPLYRKGNTFLFHSPLRRGSKLQQTIEGVMGNPYFPVGMSAMGAKRHFLDLEKGPVNINGAVIRSAPLHHPQGCAGYRIEADSSVFVLATDTEPSSPLHDRAVRDLAQDADLLLYDSQYTPDQLEDEKKGWGHSSWQEGVRIAQERGVKRLVLFHHDPDSDDAFVDSLVAQAREEFPNTMGAAEGLEFHLSTGEATEAGRSQGAGLRAQRRFRMELPVRLIWEDPRGETKEAAGVARDISSSGIYFIGPDDLRLAPNIELEVLIPHEITHHGDLRVRLHATAVRYESLEGTTAEGQPRLGVGARVDTPLGPSPTEKEKSS
jgi:phosphoribosyl 1,2-cyclic phosphodiesterase